MDIFNDCFLNLYAFQMVKNAHMRQIEQMESEELMTQKKLRTEVIQLEDMLAQVRKEYEMLRIEFEQNLAANEQTGPINKEMRNLIQSLQTHNVQLKVRNLAGAILGLNRGVGSKFGTNSGKLFWSYQQGDA